VIVLLSSVKALLDEMDARTPESVVRLSHRGTPLPSLALRAVVTYLSGVHIVRMEQLCDAAAECEESLARIEEWCREREIDTGPGVWLQEGPGY
jgi:hypothetical protein